MSDSVTVDASAPMQFGGDVRTVLESPRATMPPKTLEEARNQPGRREQIAADHQAHRVRGHQVRLLPAGLGHGPGDGEGRRRLLLPAGRREGLPARLRRHRQPLRRPRRRLHRLRPRGVRARRHGGPVHLRDAPLGQPRRARVLRLLRHGDGRAARRRPAPEPQARGRRVRGGARLPVPDRHRAGDDVAQEGRGRLARPRA